MRGVCSREYNPRLTLIMFPDCWQSMLQCWQKNMHCRLCNRCPACIDYASIWTASSCPLALTQLEQELQQAAAQTASQALERAETIVNLYVGGLVHSEGLDEKERGPADELIFLAVACLVGTARHHLKPPFSKVDSLFRARTVNWSF